MTRTRSFSIYLLKNSFAPAGALEADHGLQAVTNAAALPFGSVLYILPSVPRDPWWKGFFGIPQALPQQGTGALVFIPAEGRWFALSFGHVSHNLKADSYEYDFGLRVTLNSVDRSALKSTDIFEPGSARRRRVQVPTAADLTIFDITDDSSILKSLTGKVKPSRAHLFKNATGASNLRISSKVEPNALTALCAELLSIYDDDDYKSVFPDIQSVSPVSDPSIVSGLNDALGNSLRTASDSASLTVPDIINYNESLFVTFSGEGQGHLYDDADVSNFYDYLDEKGKALARLDLKDLRRYRLVLVNEDNQSREAFPFYKSLIFDTPGAGGVIYHLSDGSWYRFEQIYVSKMRTYLDPLFIIDAQLMPFNHGTEGAYNLAVAAANADVICLDMTSISPSGLTQVEPCDLFSVEGTKAVLRHVKISTRSSQLSHLFNQGTTSVELLKSEAAAAMKLNKLVASAGGGSLVGPIGSEAYAVRYCIVTAKDPLKRSDNLPLFSRMTLMRAAKFLRLMSVDRSVCFIEDQSPVTPKKKIPRKKKTASSP